ncbi:hypothetical protein IU404_00702 [Limosilactobacillus reuteri]|nr:hypothetical protein IU404_00702 [Limosilactobacillus reuteri]UFK68078.1 hypothetical protein IVR12_01112 [Limosilactobacillus reuteri]
MKQHVLPIKDTNILREVQDTLLNNFRYGRRNYTIFQVGKATLLRVSDVLALRRNEIFADDELSRKMRIFAIKRLKSPIFCI